MHVCMNLKPPYAIGSVPSLSGHVIAYRWCSLPRVRRHRASEPQASPERLLPWQVTMDQLICASFSHTHYWYEVGILQVLAIYTSPFPPKLGSRYECGRVFPAGAEPGSSLRDAANWLPSRFGLSVETPRRYGWCAPLPSSNFVLFGGVAARERQGTLSRRSL